MLLFFFVFVDFFYLLSMPIAQSLIFFPLPQELDWERQAAAAAPAAAAGSEGIEQISEMCVQSRRKKSSLIEKQLAAAISQITIYHLL